MKSDLIILKYKTEKVIGTKSTYDERTFFGSKMMDIESSITIDDSYIQYSEVVDNINKRNNGFQYYNDIDSVEKQNLIYLSNLKESNIIIYEPTQSIEDKLYNTNWILEINWKNILIEYLFYKLKESRVFRNIKYDDTLQENINIFIHKYIENNILNKYEFYKIDLYIEYTDLDQISSDNNLKLSYEPIYDPSIKFDGNKISNVNLIVLPDILSINYKQIESSRTKTFKYYFDLYIDRT